MKQQLPNWPLRFLRWYCREDFLEEIEGDLAAIYFRQYEQSPVKAGKTIYPESYQTFPAGFHKIHSPWTTL
jgi:putative ABC transport system permease protein